MSQTHTDYSLDLPEIDTILAALRFYQQSGMGEPANRPDWLQAIACDHDQSLDDDGIDDLCEYINTGDRSEDS